MSMTIYHNPKCSKSRATLALLREQGIEPTIVEYLQSPPSAAGFAELLSQLQLSARELMRKGEAVYKERNLADASLSEQQLIDAMVADPILMERPVVVTRKGAAIGRPPENVLAIL